MYVPPGDMNRDVFFLEDLLESQMAQPYHKGYQVQTSPSIEWWQLVTERAERPSGGDVGLSGETENFLETNCGHTTFLLFFKIVQSSGQHHLLSFFIKNFRLTLPDEKQGCLKMLLFYFNKLTPNEDLQLSCLENLQCTEWWSNIFCQPTSWSNLASSKSFDVYQEWLVLPVLVFFSKKFSVKFLTKTVFGWKVTFFC